MNEDYLTITEAARLMMITRQAVYVALKHGRLKAKKYGTQWLIHKDDLNYYREHKYSRKTSRRENGDLLYDPSKGEYSVSQVAKLAKCSTQRVYHLVRTGQLPTERVGAAHVIKIEDVSSAENLINSLYQ